MKPASKTTKSETAKLSKAQPNPSTLKPKTPADKKSHNQNTSTPNNVNIVQVKQETVSSQLEKTETVTTDKKSKVEQVKQEPIEEKQKFVLPPINFMDKVFEELAEKKPEEKYKQIPIGSVYQGFKTIPIQELEEKKIHKQVPMDGGKILWEKKNNKVYCYKESCQLSKKSANGFFQTLYNAYMFHGDLKITPDDVWLTIMLFFSKYVNKNAEKLRNAFVTHEGQKKLVVITQSTDESDWSEFFPKMIETIRKNTVEEVTSNLECKFSSTDEFATVMSTAIIMNTFKNYFKYERWGAGCGIVNIHMGGNLEDWQELQKKLDYLRQFDVDGKLKKYVNRLSPVLSQFTETYKGNAHLQFWNNIYHERIDPHSREYDLSRHINGWLIRFFTLEEQIDDSDDAKIGKIDVPIHYINLVTKVEKDFNLVGGCQGISIEDGKVYRPHFSYAIVEQKEAEKKEVKPKAVPSFVAPKKKIEEAPKSNPVAPKKAPTSKPTKKKI